MQVKRILNSIEKHKGFVYGRVEFERGSDDRTLLVPIRPRVGSRPYCSGCGERGTTYDTLRPRRFQYVPLWGLLVFLVYAMRRVDCERCGPTVEIVPWADGKRRTARSFEWFLARWAKRMSWKDVATAFGTSWDTVYRAVEAAVDWGRRHMDLSGITAIGVDEIKWLRGPKYLTVVYQIDQGVRRLLWIGQERKTATLEAFFTWFTAKRAAELRFVCSDMWKPYLKVVSRRARGALHVIDRFHVMSRFSKAIDVVRAQEARIMRKHGLKPLLKHARWLLLSRPENLTVKQGNRLAILVRYNLKAIKAYLLKEDFQHFWEYRYAKRAGTFLDAWCFRTMRSRIEPMKKVAKMLRAHRPLLMNWFKADGTISVGAVEGMNNKAKVHMRRAYGFRSFKSVRTALYHGLGNLPEPDYIHRFSG